MSRIEYVGPRVTISNHGIVYRKDKEDKYVYLGVALEILKKIDNNYTEKTSYSHHFSNKKLEDEKLHGILMQYEDEFEECISEECRLYEEKIDHKIAYVQTLSHLSDLDKQVWIRNIEIMRKYKMKRALNKMYYMHCIQDIVHVIKDKKIREITVPFNKNFFHVLNTVKGALITGKPSLETKVIETYNKEGNMIVKMMIRN